MFQMGMELDSDKDDQMSYKLAGNSDNKGSERKSNTPGMNRKQRRRQFAAGMIAVVLVLAMILSLVVVTVSAAETDGAAAAETNASGAGNSADTDAVNSGESETALMDESHQQGPILKTVADGVSLNGVDLSGKTRAQAQETADSILSNLKSAVITLRGSSDSQEVTATAGNLGLTWTNPNVVDTIAACGHGANIIARYKQEKDKEINGCSYAISVDFNQDQIRAFLESNCLAWNAAPVNASMSGTAGNFTYTEGQNGIALNEDESVQRIYQYLTEGWDGSSVTIDLDMGTVSPSVTVEDLQEMTSTLGTFTTYYAASNEARSKNIANACSMISGTVLQPGETFSVLNTITPFTEENGYELAGSYLGDEVVESFGGGICQVSTTLYNAVIRAELQVNERYNHTMVVEYVDRSSDAAIAESVGMDFKFTNTLDHPVYLAGSAYNGAITFTIYGVEIRPSNRTVSFESETLSETPSEGTKVKTDASQPVGYVNVVPGHTGYTARLWKIVKVDGVEQSRDVFNNSVYNMTPTYVTVGTAGNMTSELQSAIDSGSIDAIKQAAANAADGSVPTEADELTQRAQEAADAAYAEALAQGLDTTTALQEAQSAANAVIAGASNNNTSDGSGSADAETGNADSSLESGNTGAETTDVSGSDSGNAAPDAAASAVDSGAGGEPADAAGAEQ